MILVFEFAGKFLPECVHADEEVALALVVNATSTVATHPSVVRIVKESASAGALQVWTPPAGALAVERLAWVNAAAYARPPEFFTLAASWAALAAPDTLAAAQS